jgi:hypothetical protein
MNSDTTNRPQADENEFWPKASEVSLSLIWDNPGDVYAELLDADA